MKEINLFDYTIGIDYPKISLKDKFTINTINPHSYCVAKNDVEFLKSLRASDMLIPDGMGIVWAARILKGEKIQRIAGADMHRYLLNQAQKHSLKVFYMGSSEETLSKIEKRIQTEYPAIICKSYSPPYKLAFSEEDNQNILEAINEFQPDILFIGMTAPKQEKWVHKNIELLDAKVICSIGAVFDFYAGTVQRSSQFWIDLGLEWLPRLIREPKRLWRRNFISAPIFIKDVLIDKIRNL